ncbi:hypothetical protein Plhal703r1_c03g0015951 [Plasmopara halstedii]
MNRKSLILMPRQKLVCMKPKSGGGLSIGTIDSNNIVDWIASFFEPFTSLCICFKHLLSYGLKKLGHFLKTYILCRQYHLFTV